MVAAGLWMICITSFCVIFSDGLPDEFCGMPDEESILRRDYEYSYSLRAETMSGIPETGNYQRETVMNCTVLITHSHSCFFKLQMNCGINLSDRNEEYGSSKIEKYQDLSILARYPVMFSLNNGNIGDIYCDPLDSIFSVNAKRGVLSMFVFKLSMTSKKMKEVRNDIHGSCPLISTPRSESKGGVKTSKDLSQCFMPERADSLSYAWSLILNKNFISQFLSSTAECEYDVNLSEKKLEKVKCEESYYMKTTFSPLNPESARISIYFQMEHLQTTRLIKSTRHALPIRQTDVYFEYGELLPNPDDYITNYEDTARRMLTDLVEASLNEVTPYSIRLFKVFVKRLKKFSNVLPFAKSLLSCPDSSSKICSSALRRELAVSYLSDGLVECNTVPCIEAISYLAEKQNLADLYLDFVLYFWSTMDSHEKPEIAEHAMKICQQKKSRFCLLTLGKLINNYMKKRRPVSEVPDSIRNIASYYSDEISSTCKSCSSSSTYFASLQEKYSYLYAIIKGIGNMEDYYIDLVPRGIMPLLSCLKSKGLPEYHRIAILETLQKLNVCKSSTEICKLIRSTVVPMLLEQDEKVEVRVHVFELLMLFPERFNLVPLIVRILREDPNSQLKSYIASYINIRTQDQRYSAENNEFLEELLSELQEHKIELNKVYEGKEYTSSSFVSNSTFRVPFFPQETNEFGMTLDTSVVYRFYKMIPHFLRTNISMHLFSKIFHIAQFGFHLEGVDDIARILLDAIYKENIMSIRLEELASAFLKILSSLSSKQLGNELNHHLDETIIDNIKRIHNIYKTYKSETSAHFLSHLNLFGYTLNFVSLQDILKFISEVKGTYRLFNQLREGLVFNTSRIISLMGTHYEVPTILGLPLTWTSDLTVAYSIHSNMKISFSQETESGWNTGIIFQPSAVVTFSNRIFLSFPDGGVRGIQGNNSFYSSTQWKVKYSTSNKSWKLDVENPERPQILFQFVHKTELIRYLSYETPGDHNYEKSSKWCVDDAISHILGMKICQETSHLNKDERSNSSKSILAWSRSGIYVFSHDRSLKSYTVETSRTTTNFEGCETNVKFHTPGSTLKREVIISLSMDKAKTENLVTLRIPDLPGLSASASSKRFLKMDGTFGFEMKALFELSKDVKYHLKYKSSTHSIENSKNNAENVFKNGKKLATETSEDIRLVTPLNLYELTKKTSVTDGNAKQCITASYINYASKFNWLSPVVPSEFWETNSKAWVQIDFDSRNDKFQKNGTVFSSVLGCIKSPHIFIEFILNSVTEPLREQTHFSLKRLDSQSMELIAFLNFTYDFRRNTTEPSTSRETRRFHIATSQRSWTTEITTVANKSTIFCDAALTQAVMIARNNDRRNYVGLSNNDTMDTSEHQEKTWRFKVDFSDSDLTPLPNTSLSSDDSAAAAVNKLTYFDIGLFYPHGETQEQVTCQGKYQNFTELDLLKYQVDFTVNISRMNVKWDSFSLHQVQKDLSEIYHTDVFTQEKTGTTASYNLSAKYAKIGDCNHVDFKHNISSWPMNFTSNVSWHCKSEDPKLHVLLLNIDSYSKIWDTLNTELRQIIEDVNHEFTQETMNYTSPLMIINVTADWRGTPCVHAKKAYFKSLWEKVPSFEISFASVVDSHRDLEIDFHTKNEEKMICKMQYLNQTHDFKAEISYADKRSSGEWISVIRLNSALEDTGERMWEGMVNRSSLQSMASFWLKTYLGAIETMSSISSKSTHPINEILNPLLNATLYEYYVSLKSQGKAYYNSLLVEIRNVARRLEPFYNPLFSAISSLFHGIGATVSHLSNLTKDKFKITLNDKSFLSYFTGELSSLMSYTHTSQHVSTIRLKSSPILQLYSKLVNSQKLFCKSALSQMFPCVKPLSKETAKQLYHKLPGNKVALIFGNAYIYTFDGYFYEFSGYSSGCVSMLVHDVKKSAFSVAASTNYVHLLFPKITISIKRMNEVYINGSKYQTSLPAEDETGDVSVKREGEMIFVQSPYLSVMCDGNNIMCIFELSGWISGDVFGILGNADGEAHNDFILPDGKTPTRVVEFAAAYELSGKPECKNAEVNPKVPDIQAICRNLSQNHCSPAKDLRTAFHDTCEADIPTAKHSIWYSSKGLAVVCSLEGFPMPYEQNSPALEDRKHIRRSLEIVLLVNQHSQMNMKENAHKYIGQLMKILRKRFHAGNYVNIQYCLLGFGGKGVHYKPSIHTVDKHIWVSYEVLVDHLLRTLQFNGTDHLSPITSIQYAAEVLGYDTFNSKIFILFTSEEMQQTDRKLFESSVHHLLRNGITLYTLITHSGLMKGSILGIVANGSLLPSSKIEDSLHFEMQETDLVKITFATRGALLIKGAYDDTTFQCYLEFAEEVWNNVLKEELLCRNCKNVKSIWWKDSHECTIQQC